MILRYTIIFILSAIVIAIFLIWENNAVVVTEHNYINNKLHNNFNGFTILHISDLHNKDFRGRLTNIIKEIKPDIIVITGDLIDRRRTDLAIASKFLKEITVIAPAYYVSGNHEQLSEHFTELNEILNELHVVNMDDAYITINKESVEIGLIGIADPAIKGKEKNYSFENNENIIRNKLKDLIKSCKTDFKILLCHRSEQINVYKEFNLDLVFSGHAHGGQIRIPLLGGILAPNQGFFPKYSEGIHNEGLTSMVVSRGLGNSIFPFRIFNRPELVVVNLRKF